MTASTFKILKPCLQCGNMFEAQKRTTKYCSHKCNSRHYKIRKRLEVKEQVEKEALGQTKVKPKVNALSLALIKEKEYLSVLEVATLFSCSKMTVYRMINQNQLNANNLCERLTRVKRSDIDKLFTKPIITRENELKVENCYLMEQITERYNVSRNTIYNYCKKHNIQRLKSKGKTYYSMYDIDRLFKQ